jgi:hypothetical protein
MNSKRYRGWNWLSEKGQSIVEISLMTPLVLVALYIPADFGIAYFIAHLTENAVREAARLGTSLGGPFGNAEGTQVRNAAQNNLPALLSSPTVSVRYLNGGTTDCMEVIEVTATGNYNFFLYQLLRLLGLTAPDTMTITRSVQMRYDYQPFGNNAPCTVAGVTV